MIDELKAEYLALKERTKIEEWKPLERRWPDVVTMNDLAGDDAKRRQVLKFLTGLTSSKLLTDREAYALHRLLETWDNTHAPDLRTVFAAVVRRMDEAGGAQMQFLKEG